MKMLGDLAIRCEHGCCRIYGHKTGRGYKCERRQIKRNERNKWRNEVTQYKS